MITLSSGCGKLGEDVEVTELAAAAPPIAANQAPIINGVPPRIIKTGVSYTFTPSASDPDSDSLTFDIRNQPGWTSFDISTGTLSGVAFLGSVGTYNDVEISVSDGQASAALPAFSITVEPTTTANMPPEISGIPETSVIVGGTYSFTPAASDPDGDPLTFSVVNIPGWAGFDSATGEIFGTPNSSDEGQYNDIAITVSDGRTTSSLPAFTINVITANTRPEISGTPKSTVTVGSNYSFTPTGSDPDGDSLTFSIQNQPGWASFDSLTGRLDGTPSQGDVGVHNNITITVNDGQLGASLPAFNIEVIQPSNRPPTISGAAGGTVTAGTTYSFIPTASDPDGDSLTFSIQNLPTWGSFDDSTGQLTGTPSLSDVGLYSNIGIAVTDGQLSTSLAAFNIAVLELPATNSPPTISGSPDSSVDVGDSYSFAPTASDPDGDSLTFSIQNLPTWVSFDDSTGQLTGTPSQSDVGLYSNIGIAVTDGQLSTSLATFNIEVTELAPTNSAPSISGSPDSVVNISNNYIFTPTASDPDGDSLTFTIQNRPSWASFDGSTGQLTGIPSSADEGVYSNIRITVTDGQLSALLPQFSINVSAVALGSVTLSWTPPTLNSDGSALTDLTAYKFYYGLSEGNYPNEIRVNNPGIATYVIEDLTPNTYYFVVTVFNSANVESVFSIVAVKTVN